MEEAIDAMPDGSRALAAAAYLTGMLSLLHLAYHMELCSFVEELPVSDFIRVAILDGGGVLGELLSVAELLERGYVDAATVGLQRLAVSPAGVLKVVGCY
jgi:EAL and modified HD-GYP domain-containing signal transduction protein